MGRAQFSFIRTKWLRAGIPARPKYTCNYEGGSSEGGPQTRDLSQMVMWSDRLSWPRSCSETHFYVSISLTWVGLGLHHFHAGQAPASSFRPGSGLGRALVSRLEVGPFSSFLGLAQRGPWKPRGFFFFFLSFSGTRMYLFTFSFVKLRRWLLRPTINCGWTPSPFIVSWINQSLHLTGKVS